MTCEMCGKKPAVVLFTQIVKNEKTALHLCETCAEKRGLTISLETIQSSVNSLIAGALAASQNEEGEEPAGTCPSCGWSYAEFKAKGRLGCEACYRAFAEPLEQILKNVHGNTSHTGKVPAAQLFAAKRRQKIGTMRVALKQAIQQEEFEEAARLRDRIAAMAQEPMASEILRDDTP
ncbi:MAG: UvrB/UvrC motif-containing protein [Candidatus Latescibacterota bacterium]